MFKLLLTILLFYSFQFFYSVECISFFHVFPDPPPRDNIALMARYIVHDSEWTTLSYIGNQSFMSGVPMGRVYSVSDGTIDNSTGVPYIMLSPMDLTYQDVMVTKNCSLTLSLAQSNYCKDRSYDPEDPRCAQLILTGTFVKLEKNDPEWLTAKEALWTRHPEMENWPIYVPGHSWQFAKVNIEHITLIDNFGGRRFPNIDDYFKAKPISKNKYKSKMSAISIKKNVIIDYEF
ncbi:protein CREG1-like [Daktulosphaira vitifoliae]|uniref:protein CREG1-like n=1 Tax=Daktulosphaira vitifoliae TaxID=58002 RepID=UPI0021A9BBBC|nr:protein CREG1-like [Daktulosphaira vitifoliae]